MKSESVSGEGKYGSYSGTINLFDTLDEYRTHLKNGGSTDVHGDVMKSINDFERRKQLGALRPGPATGTGVRKYTTAISSALKAGTVDEDALQRALKAAGVEIPDITQVAPPTDTDEEEEEEEEEE